jgi:hypothetical protein
MLPSECPVYTSIRLNTSNRTAKYTELYTLNGQSRVFGFRTSDWLDTVVHVYFIGWIYFHCGRFSMQPVGPAVIWLPLGIYFL